MYNCIMCMNAYVYMHNAKLMCNTTCYRYILYIDVCSLLWRYVKWICQLFIYVELSILFVKWSKFLIFLCQDPQAFLFSVLAYSMPLGVSFHDDSFFAFIPLYVGNQLPLLSDFLGCYSVSKKNGSISWRHISVSFCLFLIIICTEFENRGL